MYICTTAEALYNIILTVLPMYNYRNNLKKEQLRIDPRDMNFCICETYYYNSDKIE